MNVEKVNVVGAQGKSPKLYDSNIKKEVKYLDRKIAGF